MLEKLFFKQDMWSISINKYIDGDQFDANQMKPTITAQDVKDCNAIFVADPFLIQHEGGWYVFYEVLPGESRKGVIAYSYSEDGVTWKYGQVVLQTDYHLSYPYIFKVKDKIYMVPEGGADGNIKLYEATHFPTEWTFVKELKKGQFYDASLFYYEDKWWMMAMGVSPQPNSMYLFYAEDLLGEWQGHHLNPIITNNPMISRPGGRVYQENGRLIRFAQDGSKNYGRRLIAFEITQLTTTSYSEVQLRDVFGASETPHTWNQDGMHHLDIQRDDQGYLVAVDGYYYKSINKIYNKVYRFIKGYSK